MSSAPENRQHSLRSACERCRLHKLRCTVPPQQDPQLPAQCTRCTRAKAKCDFKHRAPPKHRTSAIDRPFACDSTKPAAATMQSDSMSYMSSRRVELPPSAHSFKTSSVWETLLDKTTPQEPRADFNSLFRPAVLFDLQSINQDEVDLSASALSTTELDF
ncbi:uncharacterized protein TRUGW13939_08581 [Talaromyces rugulosus]|uniref:Zn(2)-C6 fungal-type domain-containing protein n=1 Tax=Talaromyces rugulosus TaxID=121627 RepID=A0A7H8R9P3_TALRU|nr:uncharacterized protein TRUGW13939_08581 [Talaromyces rugulosus]QKX61433.1 hypothetical protein TRUGW13939_08581 [Talaromyces rugulosus]